MALPGPKAVKDLFEGMLGREVLLGDAPPVPIDTAARPTMATYLADSGAIGTVVVMDFALTAWVGAALGLVPAGGATIAIGERDLPASLLENAAEFLNVLAAPISEASGTHQRLVDTYGPGELPPSHISAWATILGSRADYWLTIAGYGPGGISIVADQQ